MRLRIPFSFSSTQKSAFVWPRIQRNATSSSVEQTGTALESLEELARDLNLLAEDDTSINAIENKQGSKPLVPTDVPKERTKQS